MTKEDIIKLIKKQKVAIISSINEHGYPVIRAMLRPRKIERNELYFSTNLSSNKVSEYNNCPKACVYFYKKVLISYTGIGLIGKMEVLTNQEIKNEIWKLGDSIFYKNGKTDPDYFVLKFTIENTRFYKDLKTEDVKF